MDERKKRILRAIIEEYVKTVEPVGSRTIAKHHDLGISPATVRNEMSDLEELGYLEQPHTSAGRVPSAKGYRLYVDELMDCGQVSQDEAQLIQHTWHASTASSTELFLNMARLISQVSHSMSLFLAPAHDRAMVKYIHVLPLGASQAVMVVITETGALDNELMSFGEPVASDVLQSAALQFSNALQNWFIQDITKASLAQLIPNLHGQRSILLVFSETLLRAITKRKLFYSVGTTELLQQPEFRAVERMQPILSLVEQPQELTKALGATDSHPLQVTIGTENQMESLHDMSVIQADFSHQDQQLGTLAILGPTRMEYSRIISMLQYMKQLMDMMARNQ